MVQAFQELTEAFEKLTERFYGVTVGEVINLLDPLALGRVQVRLEAIDSLDLSPWARVAMPMAGIAHGFYFIPSIGDRVLVVFEHGNLKAPYVIGSLWSATAPPPLPSPLPQVRTIRTPVGNQIMFTEIPPSITITVTTPSGIQTISLSPAGLQLASGTNLISMTPAGINITSDKPINIASGQAVMIAGGQVAAVSLQETSVGSTGVCRVTAPQVKINSP